MATITRFEDLEIWKEARKLSKEIFLITLNNVDLKMILGLEIKSERRLVQ